jgi:hypothetical protein
MWVAGYDVFHFRGTVHLVPDAWQHRFPQLSYCCVTSPQAQT